MTFSPRAWLKLRLFLHADEVEVGFFGISAADNLLYVDDVAVLKQTVTQVTVAFDDAAVAEHFDSRADAGVSPARCGRIWIHTHPGSSPMPSSTDEETFSRVFGACDWAIMAIVARNGASYVRLAFNAGPGGHVILPLEVDWDRFPRDLLKNEGLLDRVVTHWMDEYGQKVHPEPEPSVHQTTFDSRFIDLPDELDDLYEQCLQLEEWEERLELEKEVYEWNA